VISRRRRQPHLRIRLQWRCVVVPLGLWLGLVGAACHNAPDASDVSVTWTAEPTPPVAGVPVVADLTLHDAAGLPVRGAKLHIEGHMSHPGMGPVLAVAEEGHDGVYQVRFLFTMAGDWVVLVKGLLPDGRRLNHRVDVTGVRPPG